MVFEADVNRQAPALRYLRAHLQGELSVSEIARINVLRHILLEHFPGAPDETAGVYLPWLYGRGAVDEIRNVALAHWATRIFV